MQNAEDIPGEDEMIYGLRPVIEAIRAERPINKILIQKGMQKDLFLELKEELAKKKYTLQFVPVYKLNKMTRKNHQGVIAISSPVVYADLENIVRDLYESGELGLFLVLDSITDVRNFGAIARTAECLGVHAIVIPEKDSVTVTSDAIKTSAGALNSIPVCRVRDLSSALHIFKTSGIQVIGCSEKSERPISKIDFQIPTAVIVGSEEHGISARVLADCDKTAKIPLQGKIDSLNVSVAAGMILYEVLRQREQ